MAAPPPPNDSTGSPTGVDLAGPSSPIPTSSSPAEPVDVALTETTSTLDLRYFDPATASQGDLDDESAFSDVRTEFDRLNSHLRKRRAPMVQPVQPVSEQPFPLMRLPLELREHIYDDYFRAEDRLETYEVSEGLSGTYNFEFALLRTSKQVSLEAQRSWRKNVFVRLETPWPHAVHHITCEGQVPIVAAGLAANKFSRHTALVQITAPLHHVVVPDQTIILLLEDLPKFTEVWYYSALNYTELNQQIYLTLALRDPYYSADPKPIPLTLQKKLLLPFADVKNLYETEFHGYDDTIVAELRRRMAIPYPTPQDCLEKATAIMEEGDHLLTENSLQSALDAYIRAFDAIHIKISGRYRRVLADGFFADDITAGRFAGQAAMTVRVILRIRLVARVILTHLRMNRPDEAAFWGIRSVKIMREGRNIELENFFTDFMGSSDVARIHAWTAIALTLMERDARWADERELYKDEEAADCKCLWRRAGIYLAGLKWDADRKNVVEEARRLGVGIPSGAKFLGEGEEDADSLSHLNLAAVET